MRVFDELILGSLTPMKRPTVGLSSGGQRVYRCNYAIIRHCQYTYIYIRMYIRDTCIHTDICVCITIEALRVPVAAIVWMFKMLLAQAGVR